ncbi:hypothetical protein A2757_00635 [Candidatus Giovannonibacteria bacterium RIFCSPHIGHO2_01_FULL_48_47]|nr:MAG: hypothetical protein A2757_00635 [Candidatus Giovannonibacteria bacterium RIFCSPHIGHO2_01_FULL_48_47]OGF87976.1 MAG: hypothetical protein A3B26_03745 [Candidatus Giovannonibacteria bacterium RIFCSPLOWO2_01_FULL_48_47]OGF96217.1 MAG: hypothetical protein A2613_01450 [Candidatus Giovannonibacteria bacterium RIFOXYD1_FULL_48_21]HBT81416.1 hypothetical protein [Candidatus Giovannonibacteria bacterium]
MAAFDSLKISEEFLQTLPKRVRDVLERRFGIGKSKERKTLEAIGAAYGITRERVRQIEAHGLKKLRAHEFMKEKRDVFESLKSELSKRGGIAEEENFLTTLAASPAEKNHLRFLLTLAEDFKRHKEDEEFRPRWSVDDKSATACRDTLRVLHKELEGREPLEVRELKAKLASLALNNLGAALPDEALDSWLLISKLIAANKLGGWGLAASPHISPRGVRDLAYLVMKRHGSPLHFSEVAQTIKKTLGEEAHVQTVHNELIKDGRFVLVGRGLYALKEWGYQPGTVKEVIRNILTAGGPLPKDKLIEKVLKERHVKTATILINLQDKKLFGTLEDGRISLV